jgi:hypothetical protein
LHQVDFDAGIFGGNSFTFRDRLITVSVLEFDSATLLTVAHHIKALVGRCFAGFKVWKRDSETRVPRTIPHLYQDVWRLEKSASLVLERDAGGVFQSVGD